MAGAAIPQHAPSLSPGEALRQAIGRHDAGELGEAEQLYRAVLRAQPRHADANHRLGKLLVQGGEPQTALLHLKAAVEVNPAQGPYWISYIEALLVAGTAEDALAAIGQAKRHGLRGARVNALRQRVADRMRTGPSQDELAHLAHLFSTRRHVEAEALARRMTEAWPNHGFGWMVLGTLLGAQQRLAEALPVLLKSAELLPSDPAVHNNLGNALMGLGRLSEAEARYRRALELNPALPDGYGNLGNIQRELGRLPEAEASYRRALELEPDFHEAHNNLGNILRDLGRLPEAEASFRRALELKPDFIEAHNNLGSALRDAGRLAEAEACYRRAREINPALPDAHNNLGNVLHDLGRSAEAEASYRSALQFKPDFHEAHCNLGGALMALGRFAEAERSCRRALELKQDYCEAYSNLLFGLNCTASRAPSVCLEEARRFGQMLERTAGARYSDWSCAPRPARLRVGLVSGDLRNHPVGHFLEGLLARIDPARLELIAYPTFHWSDELTARLRGYCSAWKPLLGLNDEAAARLIHGDGVHVLLDLSGHTARNRLPVFARKPAPVQASWLGYFATTGVAAMDYLLADETGVPEEQRAHFTETVWILPDTRLCFTAPDSALPVAALPALANGRVTFGCFQNLPKVGDQVLAAWGKILAALPDARLRLQCKQLGHVDMQERFAIRLRQHGVDPARTAMHAAGERDAYLAAHAEVDLVLDTFPYPGGTTTCEAMWMGVPTLTLAGDRLLARQGASLLTAAGLADWVAASEEDYVDKAIARARDIAGLASLRAGLRPQVLASPLFDAARFARNFEAALWDMWLRRAGA